MLFALLWYGVPVGDTGGPGFGGGELPATVEIETGQAWRGEDRGITIPR
jgi:hypothetical protein